jgi:MFS family permease
MYALLLFALANVLHYANRSVILHTKMYDDLRDTFGFTRAELGLLGTTAFMIPHGLATLLAGWLGDRIDRRRVLCGGIVLWSAAAVATMMAEGMNSLLTLRALQGIGCAACVPVVNAMVSRLFSQRGRARAISVFNLGLLVGGVLGFVAGWWFGFPTGFIVVGLPGFAVALAVLFVPLPDGVATFQSKQPDFLSVARETFGRSALRRMYVGGMFMAFASGGYLAWFTEFLEKVKGMAPERSTTLTAVAMLGGFGGVVAGGALADAWLRRTRAARQITVSLGLLCAVPCAIVAIELEPGVPFYVASCLLMFFINTYHAPIAAGVDEQVAPEHAATAQGVYVFFMHMFGTAPSGAIVGKVADRIGLLHALYVPTAAVLVAAVFFLLAARAVVQRQGT